jgi:hypothetical protein
VAIASSAFLTIIENKRLKQFAAKGRGEVKESRSGKTGEVLF